MKELAHVLRLLARAATRRRRTAVFIGAAFVLLAVESSVVLAGGSPLHHAKASARAANPIAIAASHASAGSKVIVGHSVKNDTSPALRSMPPIPLTPSREHQEVRNPFIPNGKSSVGPDRALQTRHFPNSMPNPILNFDGIPFPGVTCNCAPPDTNGEVGLTQYVQIVNEGYQVFDKNTGNSVLGPQSIVTVWAGFGGVCQNNGDGDPVVLYDQLADRWVITQFAGSNVPTDECIAVSSTSDATGAYHRYDFHLGTDFFDYPHLGVWPDAYYMSMNVFNSSGTALLGPQPFAFDRAAMLAGTSATFVTFRDAAWFNPSNDYFMPADLDGANPPPVGAPNPFTQLGDANTTTWHLFRFHVDFATPANSTFTLGTSLSPAAYSVACSGTRSCVPQGGTSDRLDGLADRPMFRMAYRHFDDGHEALVGNMTVLSNAVTGIRWFELDHATSGTATFVQQSTYQPDSTWRWMGSAAMDHSGDLAVGFSASSATINPQIRYAGRLAGDPANQLAQGEAHLFDGAGSQSDTVSRWGDYSDLTVDPSTTAPSGTRRSTTHRE